MNYKLHISENAVGVAKSIAEEIYIKAKNKKSENTFLNLAVSGGSTPRLLFEILAAEYNETMPWEAVRIFWVDERCVPPLHPESNYGMTHDALLSKIDIPASNIFRMKGEEEPESEAIRYRNILVNELSSANNFPVFDLILLGMGDDGHTASIFPNQMHLNTFSESVAVATHPVTGQKRITLTGNTIRNAHEVVFMITGENKAKILAEIVKQKPQAKNYPASYMYSINDVTIFYVDSNAASLL
jgi:6-phosphogluconolactonase